MNSSGQADENKAGELDHALLYGWEYVQDFFDFENYARVHRLANSATARKHFSDQFKKHNLNVTVMVNDTINTDYNPKKVTNPSTGTSVAAAGPKPGALKRKAEVMEDNNNGEKGGDGNATGKASVVETPKKLARVAAKKPTAPKKATVEDCSDEDDGK